MRRPSWASQHPCQQSPAALVVIIDKFISVAHDQVNLTRARTQILEGDGGHKPASPHSACISLFYVASSRPPCPLLPDTGTVSLASLIPGWGLRNGEEGRQGGVSD